MVSSSSVAVSLAAILSVLCGADGYYQRPARRETALNRYFDSLFDPFSHTFGVYPFDSSSRASQRQMLSPFDYLDALAERRQRRKQALSDMMDRREQALKLFYKQVAKFNEDEQSTEDDKSDAAEESVPIRRTQRPLMGLRSFGLMEVEEDADRVTYGVDLQGGSPTNIEVKVDEKNRVLHIRSGSLREQKGKHSFWTSSQSFSQALRLPDDVDPASMKTDHTDSGVRINFVKLALPETENAEASKVASPPEQTEVKTQEQTEASKAAAPREKTMAKTQEQKSATEKHSTVEKKTSQPEEAPVQRSQGAVKTPYVGSLKIDETADGLTYTTPLTGVEPTNVRVEVDEKTRMLSIRAEGRSEQKEDHGYSASSYSYSRSFRLPENADPASMKTDFTDKGVTVSFTKTALPGVEKTHSTEGAVPRPPESTAKTPTGPIMEEDDGSEGPQEDTSSGEIENL